jgi:hypothetical protein
MSERERRIATGSAVIVNVRRVFRRVCGASEAAEVVHAAIFVLSTCFLSFQLISL